MKASVFIKVALVDQMQQIADLGLWFHLSRLIPPGVEVLARVWYKNEDYGVVFLPDRIEDLVGEFYKEVMPGGYCVYPDGQSFFNVFPKVWLTHLPEMAEFHLKEIPYSVPKPVNELAGAPYCSPKYFYVHIPQWFADFKSACKIVLDKIEAGELQDIEVLKIKEA